jgi:hypothetical protein
MGEARDDGFHRLHDLVVLAFRATSPGRAALDGDDTVSVTAHADFWIFTKRLTVDAILLTLAEAERRAARSVRARFRG